LAESTQEPAGPGSEPANGVEAAQERVRPLVSLGFSRFRLVMASFLVGFVAFQMCQTANLWLVYDLTGSTLNLGLLGVFQFAPVLVLGLVGGVLADVVDRKTLLLFAMACHLALSVAVFAVFAVSRNFLLSVVALVVRGGLDGVGAILRQTALQLMVPDEVRGRASAVLQVSNRGGPSMGFIVLGAMAFWLGAPGAMLTGVVIAGFVLATIVVLRRDVAGYRG